MWYITYIRGNSPLLCALCFRKDHFLHVHNVEQKLGLELCSTSEDKDSPYIRSQVINLEEVALCLREESIFERAHKPSDINTSSAFLRVITYSMLEYNRTLSNNKKSYIH